MYTDRRRYVTITFTSVLYFLLLSMLHSSTALPSSYLKFLNDNQPELSPQFLNDAALSNSGSSSSEESQDLILLRSGRPISLKEFAASLSAASNSGAVGAGAPGGVGIERIPPARSPLLVKRQNSGEETMLRLARNMPEGGVGEKMYQISNIGEILPMFRFG